MDLLLGGIAGEKLIQFFFNMFSIYPPVGQLHWFEIVFPRVEIISILNKVQGYFRSFSCESSGC